MRGFFKTITKAVVKKNPAPLVKTCADCPLKDQECANRPVQAKGAGKKEVLILSGTMRVKKASVDRLRSELKKVKIDLDEDCFFTSVIQSNNPSHEVKIKDKTKEVSDSATYLDCCRIKILDFIKSTSPKVILCLGDRAISSLVKHRSDFRGRFPKIDNWESHCIPDQEYCAWIVPTWNIPMLEEYEEKDNGVIYTKRFRASLKMLADKLKEERIEKRNDVSFCNPIMDDEEAIREIEKCQRHIERTSGSFASFDYETTGIKPYAKGQKIICVSICYKDDYSFSFMLNNKTWPHFDSFLKNKNIKKVAHNIKFEEIWTREKRKIKVAGWKADTMLDAHILDNRTGLVGLKLQTYLYFGIAGYDHEIDPFLDAPGSNDLNKIEQASPKNVLKYCALDSLYGYWLAKKQDEIFDNLAKKHPEVREARKLFLQGALALVSHEHAGMRIDKNKINESKAQILKRIEELNNEILQDPIVVQWRKRMGKAFNINSPQQLEYTIYTQLGHESTKKTKTGRDATDAKTIAEFGVSFVEKMLEQKKLKKVITTYLDAFVYEATDGVMHPFLSLSGPRSFRSSSNSPNIQNIPKRWEMAKKLCRFSIIPESSEFCFFEADYKSMEVGIGACYHNDSNMHKYLRGHGDMHRDAALDCFILHENPDLMTKNLRQGGKNGFVFPEFYGDYYGNCAVELWKTYVLKDNLADGTPLKKWLEKHKIKTFEQFKKHMKQVELVLQKERFPEFFQWRKDQYEEYIKRGYYVSKTGFPYFGIMDLNDSANYAIQGSAFHCLLWDLIKIDKYIERMGMKSFCNGEIHDAIVGNVHITEINHFFSQLELIMVDQLLETHSWITAPVSIEIEMGAPGASWAEMKAVERTPEPCECGLEWAWAGKPDHKKNVQTFTCPICKRERAYSI